MSEENLEVVRRAIEAYGREGLDGVLGYYDPEIEWTSTSRDVGGERWRSSSNQDLTPKPGYCELGAAIGTPVVEKSRR